MVSQCLRVFVSLFVINPTDSHKHKTLILIYDVIIQIERFVALVARPQQTASDSPVL